MAKQKDMSRHQKTTSIDVDRQSFCKNSVPLIYVYPKSSIRAPDRHGQSTDNSRHGRDIAGQPHRQQWTVNLLIAIKAFLEAIKLA